MPLLSLDKNFSAVSSARGGSKGFDLNRFAFTNRTTARKVATQALTLPSSRNKTTQAKPPPTRTMDFLTPDLAQISRCVCCALAWTARKTSTQKMLHIRSCAKKHGFTEDTLQILLHKEAEKLPATVPSRKGKEKELGSLPEESFSKKTYMEDILVGVDPRKKVKSKDSRILVTNISETRGNILSRARLVLSSSNTSLGSTPVVHSTEPTLNATGINDGDYDYLLPSTQAFGQSSLGQFQGATSKPLFALTSPPPSPSPSQDREGYVQ